MSIPGLVPIMFPALLIVAAAVWLVARERSERDVVLDLREVAVVRLAEVDREVRPARSVSAPLSGRLVEPQATGTLGARLRIVEPSIAEPGVEAACRPKRRSPRRTQPLVAVSRAQAS